MRRSKCLRWSLALRCGNENIIVAERSLAAAEQLARKREGELRRLYVPDMPAFLGSRVQRLRAVRLRSDQANDPSDRATANR